MNNDSESEIRSGCVESYAELCALSMTNALSPGELSALNLHLISCKKCRSLLSEYRDLTSTGMAELVATSNEPWEDYARSWDEDDARRRLLRQVERRWLNAGLLVRKFFSPFSSRLVLRPAYCLAVTILFLMSALIAFQSRTRRQDSFQNAALLRTDPLHSDAEFDRLKRESESLKSQISENAKIISRLTQETQRLELQLSEVDNVKLRLQNRIQQLSQEDDQKSDTLRSLASQRDDVQHQLENGEESRRTLHDELLRAQNERQEALLKTANLERTIGQLSSELQDMNSNVQRQRDFLASDRDIRELMGARQLYIADVFDIDHNGNKRKAYGRIFYTKGKSLVFYAFDLDQQPGYHNAKAVQVWGSSSEDQSNAVNLGVFYLDSEVNRRWVFKTDDPAVLENINAVFVTIEPKEANAKLARKPFLYAYLRTAPANHP
jgi:hypothetical protein